MWHDRVIPQLKAMEWAIFVCGCFSQKASQLSPDLLDRISPGDAP